MGHGIKDTVLIVCARAGYDDLLFGGRDVGSILVYPQSRAISSLHETEWNNPFNVLSTDSNGVFYQQFIDADGDGDLVRQFVRHTTKGSCLVATQSKLGAVGRCFIHHLGPDHHNTDV